MPRPKKEVPSYRRQKHKGRPDRAFVELDGDRVWLGEYGTPESKERYAQCIAEWKVGRCRPTAAEDEISITELAVAFLRHADQYYRRPDGTPTSEIHNYRMVLAVLRELYGTTPAAEFGPKRLRTVRQRMIELRWCRRSINRQVSRIRALFKWAVAQEMITADVHHALTTLSPLHAGRTEAEESGPVRPVDEAVIEATKPHLSKQVRAMVELQLLSGMRPGEMVAMRPRDIDRTTDLWTYRPAQHKTRHHGHERIIFLGKQAQVILSPYLLRPDDKPLFSPAEAERERRETAHQARKTPLSCGNIPGSNKSRSPKRPRGDQYDVTTYRRAIARAADRADRWGKGGRIIGNGERLVPRWNPHQLRHNAATRLRARYGLEVAQVILGHATLTVTQVYAEKNIALAQKIVAEAG